ncbi:MAG: hypothetical protein HKN88_06905 [Gammaproteobacteria bacterium]|nr:hypothetical protein [Gammaproteobacteria bacterium]
MAELEPFGYDLFSGVPTTFAPVTEIPVPQDYVLGPGDTIKVFTYGNETGSNAYTVDRNGVITVEKLGPIVVAGLDFSEAKQAIEDRYATTMIGVKTNVTMGELRSMRVFLLGEAANPGSYTVSALSTITNALFVSGGINKIGSLRNVQLKRNGKTVTTLDLYDLLLRGDTRNDVRLQPGDVIFIPTVGDQISVFGQVKRPAIYEIKREHHLDQLIQLAGGVLPEAYAQNVSITRFANNSEKEILNVDLATRPGQQVKVKAGDFVEVSAVLDEIGNSVELLGHVKRPGVKAYSKGMRLTDLLGSRANLKNKIDLNYGLIRRLKPPANDIEVLSLDLSQAYRAPGSNFDVVLKPEDKIFLFEKGVSRESTILPLLLELEQQSGDKEKLQQVSVGGRIKVPGSYPMQNVMTVMDLVRAGGGLSDAAYRLEAELSRDDLNENYELVKTHINVDLERLLAGDQSANLQLQSRDRLVIKEVPNWRENNAVEILGEVQFPGEYTIKSGETLGQLMQRVGGLSPNAFPQGALFIRKSLQEKENEYLQSLANKLEKDITLLSIEKNTEAVELGANLLSQLRETDAVGRLVIDLNSVIANVGHEYKDVILQNDDKLYIPEKTQEVTVIGEVQFPTSHLYDGRSSRNVYLQRSGGFTAKADAKRVYVVRADGRVVNREYSSWFSQGDYADINPGDTIVVPLNADRVRPLTLWTNVTQILSQIGIFAASAKTVGIL